MRPVRRVKPHAIFATSSGLTSRAATKTKPRKREFATPSRFGVITMRNCIRYWNNRFSCATSRLSADLSALAAVGLEALDYLDKSQPSPQAWRTEQLALIERAKTPKADLLLMIVAPV